MNRAHLIKNILFWLSRKINYPLVSPEVIQISLTYRCNLNCKMCSIVNLLPQEEELSTVQIFHIIDEAKAYGIKKVLFTGGEPLLRKDIYELCRYADKNRLQSIVTTNGLLLDERTVDALIGAKAGHIHVSLDGLEKTNDFFRGEGVFKKIVKNIKRINCLKKKVSCFSIGIACTVMDNNINELFDLVRFADELGVDSINFQPLINDNANFMNKQLPEFWVKKENIDCLKQEILKIEEYKPVHITVYEEPSLKLLVKYYQQEVLERDWVCFGGFKTVFICYNRRQPLVYSCHGVCGNLNEIALKKAWKSKAAWRLRLHSEKCKNFCLQSCYSRQESENLVKIIKSYGK